MEQNAPALVRVLVPIDEKFIRRRPVLPPATTYFVGISGASRAALDTVDATWLRDAMLIP